MSGFQTRKSDSKDVLDGVLQYTIIFDIMVMPFNGIKDSARWSESPHGRNGSVLVPNVSQ